MTTSAARVIRQLLGDLNHGSLSNGTWPIFVGFLPNSPDNALCVYDTAGVMDGRVMRSGERVEHPGVQIRVRALDYLAARTKAIDIATALDAQIRTEITVDALTYRINNISRAGAILPVGVEETDRQRHHFTINAITTIEEKQ